MEGSEGRAWSVELTFWHPSKLNDEEMTLFFSQRDGKWSEQTKAALNKHQARGLDLNQNWALVDQNWTCPSCQRHKTEIFRLSARGILLAKLEEHHDHLHDFVGWRARDLFGDGWLKGAPRGAGLIVDGLQNLMSSFSRELICSECNSADGAVKTRLRGKIHPHFSFSPAQISSFIRPHPNAPHEVDFVKAELIWNQIRHAFEVRLKLIDDLLQFIQSGLLTHERGTPWFHLTQRKSEPSAQLYEAFSFETRLDERQRNLWHAADEFLARSVQKDSPVLSSNRENTSASIRVPTHAERSDYCDPVSPRRWKNIADDWRCPICQRAKYGVMRWSSANKWSGGLREHYQPIAETDPLALWARRGLLPGFRNVFVMRNSEVILICSGCQEVATQLKARRQDIPDQFLYIDDFRDCLIKVEPHAPHVVDWEEVTNRVLKNTAVGSAWDAYTRYVGMASEYREQYRRKVHDLAYSHEKAVQTLSEDVMFDANIDDQGEATALTTWMLQDAEKRAQEKSR